MVRSSRQKKWKRLFMTLLLLFVGLIGWVGISGILAFKNISSKNSSDRSSFFRWAGDIPPGELKGEGDSRINIAVLGIGGEGALTDTIQIVSFDPINHTYGLLSVPRDLYVKNGHGEGSKINAAYATANQACREGKRCDISVDAGGAALKKVLTEVLDMPVQYFIRLNFTGFEKIIDQLGGVQVYVDKPLRDPFFPDAKLQGFEPLYIPAGYQTFNGARALKYARSRETTSDFDRSRRQQQIIVAVVDKILSASVLTNPKKVTDIISLLGQNLRTDLQSGEITRLITLARQSDKSKAVTKVLDTSESSPLRSLNDPKAGYIIVPQKGTYEYAELQDFVRPAFPEPFLIKEKAVIAIEDATGKAGAAKAVMAKLKSLGYNVMTSAVVVTTQNQTTIKYRNDDSPYTVALLKRRFAVTATKSPNLTVSDADVVIRLGKARNER